ncbi:MAG TPA: oligoendopeptidase F [Anaerolineae bacterium]|nr:oligoendopeptidase F [Anaerolineae bacterium]HOR01395.1 oligoendopeptidase F [Anaerolineae bacterium]
MIVSSISIPPRSEVAREHTWNAESVYPSPAAWEAEYAAIAAALPGLARFQGRLGESAAVLADALAARDGLARRVGKLVFYARMSYSVDTADQAAAALQGRAMGLVGQARAAAAFVEPELLAIGQATLARWLQEEPRLAVYAHSVADLLRKAPHLRSGEVEEVLGLLVDPFAGTSTTASTLADADFRFAPARAADGTPVKVTQGTLDTILSGPDREARRTAWEHYTDTYLAFRNTLANNLATSLRQNVFAMRVRHHPSTLAASLFEHNIPLEVFHNLSDVFRRHLPTWHRYWALRRRALAVDTLHPYDIWAPLVPGKPEVGYAQAVAWIAQALAPLGAEYAATLRRGCLEERWVDLCPNQGKMAGAFSYGSPGTSPFIMMTYDGTLESVSTLAHELGHSMHSYLTWRTQPMIYTDYALFLAEVASNFHQAMLRAHLLATNPDPAFQVAVIEEAMSNFHRYLFIMPTLARFELEMHERVERGEGLAADLMIERMADLFAESYGGEMSIDRPRVGITWATFSHLYSDYYVYQYATGISAANALSQRILAGTPGAAEAYVRFLSAGSSLYPLDALKLAGVDMATTQPVEAAFAVLAGLVDRLEALVG